MRARLLAASLTLALLPVGYAPASIADTSAKPKIPRMPRVPRTPAPLPLEAEGAGRRVTPHPLPADPTPAPTARPEPEAQPQRSGSIPDRIAAAWPGSDSKVLRVVACESEFNPTAYSGAGPYYGLFQFDLDTWASVGGSGLPSNASVEEQTERAWDLKQRRGWAPWPVCGGA